MARLAGKKEKKGKKRKGKKRGSIGGEKARAAGGEKVKGVTFWVAAVNSADTKFNKQREKRRRSLSFERSRDRNIQIIWAKFHFE